MRQPLLNAGEALRARLNRPGQVASTQFEAEMPPYMESFLGHLRLLVGVPFEYMIPDPRMLPDESIRFFYLDRSWTDRLVDGAVTVGKIGSREQAHHQAQATKLSSTLDLSERMVRPLQRGGEFEAVKAQVLKGQASEADLVTGLLIRSAVVSGWPHMDVRAYSTPIQEPFDASSQQARDRQLALLRLERLSPGVLLALFHGVPELVTMEEPHHGVQFGVDVSADGRERVAPLRQVNGQALTLNQKGLTVKVHRRGRRSDVIDVLRLRDDLQAKAANPPANDQNAAPITQSGSAAFAIAVLNPPWRQRFEGTEDKAGDDSKPSAPDWSVTERVRRTRLRLAVSDVYKKPII